jgi:DNA helicase-2/ATP-dependent DNA helicase PcrA
MGFVFTVEQEALVSDDLESSAVNAGPGSGKSRTLGGLIARLIVKDQVPPSAILGITYTEAAAESLRIRIAESVQALQGESATEALNLVDLQTGTIHSVLAALLRLHFPAYRKYRIITESERRIILRSYAPRLNLGLIDRREGAVESGKKSVPWPVTPELTDHPFDRDTFLKSADVAREECLPRDRQPAGFRKVLDRYEQILRARFAWDYSSVLVAAHAAFTEGDPECLAFQAHLRENLRCVIVDEYQDVNAIISGIVQRFRELGIPVIAVGDQDQAIFSFRGSSPGAFEDFAAKRAAESLPLPRVLSLTRNFRSSEAIVAATSAFAAEHLGKRAPKALSSSGRQSFEAGDLAALVFPSTEAQDRWGIDRLKQMHGTPYHDKPGERSRGLSWSDMAILTYTNKSARRITDGLNAAGVPARLTSSATLLGSVEARAATALFFYAGALCSRAEVIQAFKDADLPFGPAAIDAGLYGLDLVRERVTAAGELVPLCLVTMLYEALQAIGFCEEAIPAGKAEVVLSNVARIARAAEVYDSACYRQRASEKLKEFAMWLQSEADRAYEDDFSPRVQRDAGDAVRVMTLHGSKGLEFPLVWIADLKDGYSGFPSPPRPNRIWQALRSPSIVLRRQYDGRNEDSARLIYVGMTRAAKYLLLTHGTQPPVERNGRLHEPAGPSPYIGDLAKSSWFVTDPAHLPAAAALPHHEPEVHSGNAAPITFSCGDFAVQSLCPRLAKLRYVYGFPAPIAEAVGFGESLHRACREAHERAEHGDALDHEDLEEILDRHLHLPFAGSSARQQLREAASRRFGLYVDRYHVQGNRGDERMERAESSVSYEFCVPNGTEVDGSPANTAVRIIGRDDLVVLNRDGQRTIEDWKTSTAETLRDPDLLALRLYALAEEVGRGLPVAGVATRFLDLEVSPRRYVAFDEAVHVATRRQVTAAAQAFVRLDLPMAPANGAATCRTCDARFVCQQFQELL